VGEIPSSGRDDDAVKKISSVRAMRATKKEKDGFNQVHYDHAVKLLDDLNSLLKSEKLPEDAAFLIAARLKFAAGINMLCDRERVVKRMEYLEKYTRNTVDRDRRRPPGPEALSTAAKMLVSIHGAVDEARALVEHAIDLAGLKRKVD